MDKALDTKALEDALSTLFRCTRAKQYYVIPNNHMSKVNFAGPYPIAIIQNIDSDDKPGIHWVAYWIPKMFPLTYSFMDSYGKSPDYYKLSTPDGRMMEFNSLKLQTDKTSLCGHFALHYLYLRAIGYSHKEYIDIIYGKSVPPETVVRRFYSRLSLFPSFNNRKCTCSQSCLRYEDYVSKYSDPLIRYYPKNYLDGIF